MVVKGKITITKIHYLQAVLLLCILPISGVDFADSEDPVKAVGTVYCDGGIRGTASHIALPEKFENKQSIILTAAHVLYNKQTANPFKDCYYQPQNKRLSNIAFEKISAHSYSTTSKNKIAQAEKDIVFIQLKHPAYQPALKLSEAKTTQSDNLLLIGFNVDQEKMLLSNRCQRRYSDALHNEKLLLHNCPSQGGDSGAPIINRDSGEIIAVHGGKLNFQPSGKTADLVEWINQGRRIDSQTIQYLNDFIPQI